VRGPRIDDQYARPTLTGLHAEQPEPVRRWLRAPTAIRVLGPRYEPDDDTAHCMAIMIVDPSRRSRSDVAQRDWVRRA
jgi:hypothetical protein